MTRPCVPTRQVLRWAVVIALAVATLWFTVSGGRDLLVGLALWSFVAADGSTGPIP